MAQGAEAYGLGEQVGLAARFGSDDAPFDPSQVLFRISDPQGRTSELTYGQDAVVTQTAPGAYQVIIEATVPGRWRYPSLHSTASRERSTTVSSTSSTSRRQEAGSRG